MKHRKCYNSCCGPKDIKKYCIDCGKELIGANNMYLDINAMWGHGCRMHCKECAEIHNKKQR